MIVGITVVIVYVLMRYRKKRAPISAAPNNVVTTEKEQELIFSNPTYKMLNEKEHNIYSEI